MKWKIFKLSIISGIMSFSCSAVWQNVDLREQFSRIELNCDNCHVRFIPGQALQVRYERIRCPEIDLKISQTDEVLKLVNANHNTHVNYEITAGRLEDISIKGGEVEVSGIGTFSNASFNVGNLIGKIEMDALKTNINCGDAQFDISLLPKGPHQRVLSLNIGSSKGFNVFVPQGESFYSQVTFPPLNFFGIGPRFNIDNNLARAAARATADFVMDGTFASGNIFVQKKA